MELLMRTICDDADYLKAHLTITAGAPRFRPRGVIKRWLDVIMKQWLCELATSASDKFRCSSY